MKRLPTSPVARAKEKARRAARRQREQERKAKRRAKREEKARPKRALAAWSKAVRAAGRCEVCGATDYLSAHHILPKERYPEYRVAPENGVCLCPSHHKFHKYSAHRNPVWFVLWLREYAYDRYMWAKAHVGRPCE